MSEEVEKKIEYDRLLHIAKKKRFRYLEEAIIYRNNLFKLFNRKECEDLSEPTTTQ